MVGPDSPLKNGCIRNNICGSSSLKLSNCQHTCMGRITLPGNKFLQSKMDMHTDIDRINSDMRICSMRSFSCNRNFETIHGIHHRILVIVHIQTDWHTSRRYMISKRCIYFRIFENAIGNHILAALKRFLCRLKHEFYRTLERFFLFF